MLILNSNLENIEEKYTLELTNLNKLNELFSKQKDILLKHFNITIVSLTDNPSYITKLNSFLEQFNEIFDKINSALSKLQILIKKLKTYKKSLDNNDENAESLLEEYNTYYNENYSSLIDCIIYITDFINEIFVVPDYNKSVENRKKIFSSFLGASYKENIEKIEKIENKTSKENMSTTQEIDKIVSTIIKDMSEQEDKKDDSKDSIENNTENNISKENNEPIEEKIEIDKEESNKKSKKIKDTSFNRVTSLPLKDNNSLIISERDGLVYLPFRVEDLKIEYLSKSSKYSGIIDLINNEYIYPISKYKNSVTSRFREAYGLMVNKEKESKITALELGLELAFNYSLHPAVISACRNINELDDYLDALEKKDLSLFKGFNVEFESLPKSK